MKRTLAAVLLLSSTAHAQYMSGNEWLSRYQSSDPVRRIPALSYVAGVVDGSPEVCAPEGVTIGQISDMTARLMVEMAHLRHFSASHFVVAVGSAAWPCKAQPRKERL